MKTQNPSDTTTAPTTPKFSVVVPVYNIRESFFRECVESVLAQTFADFELILVNDGSTNDAGTHCDAYAKKDPRIRAFHKPNGGVSSARNLGMREARGEFVAFLDADDFWHPTFLKKIESMTRSFPRLNIFCVAHDDFKTSQADGSRITLSKTRMPDFAEGDILVYDQISYAVKKNKIWLAGRTGSHAFRRAWLKEWGGAFDERLNTGEDAKFFFDAAVHGGKCCFLNEGLNFFRKDVPAEEKNHRRELPHMQRTWIAHLDEYEALEKAHPQLKIFLDRYRIRTALWYHCRPCFKKEIKAILAQVSPKNMTLAERVAHTVPYSLQKALFKIYRLWKKRA